jgi:hypothetical protein
MMRALSISIGTLPGVDWSAFSINTRAAAYLPLL